MKRNDASTEQQEANSQDQQRRSPSSAQSMSAAIRVAYAFLRSSSSEVIHLLSNAKPTVARCRWLYISNRPIRAFATYAQDESKTRAPSNKQRQR